MPTQIEIDRLRELVRQGERLLDAQERLKAEQDEKSRHLITTCVAWATAGLAATTFYGRDADGTDLAVVVGAMSFAWILLSIAILRFFVAYTGTASFPNDLALGWDASRLRQLGDVDKGMADVLRASLRGLELWVPHNTEVLERANRLRRLGVQWLLASGILSISTFLYVALTKGGS